MPEINLNVLLADRPNQRAETQSLIQASPPSTLRKRYLQSILDTTPSSSGNVQSTFKQELQAPQAPPTSRVLLRSPRPDKKPKFLPSDDTNLSPSESQDSSSGQPCHCTKTHCLKLYCSCFHNNRLCGPQCICTDCHNDQTHTQERKDAIDFVRSKGVKAHEIDKFDTAQVWGCRCRKTHCMKRYCECFIRGKKCTSHCKCSLCENRRPSSTKNKTKQSIKD